MLPRRAASTDIVGLHLAPTSHMHLILCKIVRELPSHTQMQDFTTKNAAARHRPADGAQLDVRDMRRLVQALPQYRHVSGESGRPCLWLNRCLAEHGQALALTQDHSEAKALTQLR
jgi:hypothetical protein